MSFGSHGLVVAAMSLAVLLSGCPIHFEQFPDSYDMDLDVEWLADGDARLTLTVVPHPELASRGYEAGVTLPPGAVVHAGPLEGKFGYLEKGKIVVFVSGLDVGSLVGAWAEMTDTVPLKEQCGQRVFHAFLSSFRLGDSGSARDLGEQGSPREAWVMVGLGLDGMIEGRNLDFTLSVGLPAPANITALISAQPVGGGEADSGNNSAVEVCVKIPAGEKQVRGVLVFDAEPRGDVRLYGDPWIHPSHGWYLERIREVVR